MLVALQRVAGGQQERRAEQIPLRFQRGAGGVFAAAMGLALAQGMAVPGEVSVSETGAATYTIPIAVPNSLSYSSLLSSWVNQ